MADIEVRQDGHRFVAYRDGVEVGFAAYVVRDDALVFTHTEIDAIYEGMGFGSALVRQTLDEVRVQGHHVVPACSFMRAWIARHDDYADLVVD